MSTENDKVKSLQRIFIRKIKAKATDSNLAKE